MSDFFKYSSQKLLQIFRVEGVYYCLDNNPCRSHLIIEKNTKNGGMNFVAIMMNPGKSIPEDDKEGEYVKSKPDKTQYQLMRLMLEVNIEKMHVINLSDIREPDSKKFYKKILKLEDALQYSIFSTNRRSELAEILEGVDGVMFAWGVSKSLLGLASLAVNAVVGVKVYGIRRGEENAYYHPLQRRNRLKWLIAMSRHIQEGLSLDSQS